jgi:hypothetical protein
MDVVDSIQRSLPPEDPRTAYTLESIEYIRTAGLQTDVDLFRSDFREMLQDIIEGGISREVTTYLSSYTSVSLEEFEDQERYGTRGGSSRFAVVSDKESPWVEGYICYSLMLYLKGFGRAEIRKCKDCGRFFTGRGSHASYCSDACSARHPRGKK